MVKSRSKHHSQPSTAVDSKQPIAAVLEPTPSVSQSLSQRVLSTAQKGGSFQEVVRWLPAAAVKKFDLQACQIELYDADQRTATLISGDGKSWLGPINHPRSIEQFWQLYEPLTCGKSVLLSSQSIEHKNGSAAPLTWLGCPIMGRAQLMGNMWFTRPGQAVFDDRDLDELKRIADGCAIALRHSQLEQTIDAQQTEIQRLRKAKDEFLQLISHELFVPLGNIQLSTQTLETIFKDVSWRKVPQRSTVLKVLSLLSQECRRQKQFVDNLITLMFPEYQKTSDSTLMNLSDWLPSLLRTFEPRFEQEGLTVKTNIPQEPLLIECDITQLERTITELITNAIKYTPPKKTVSIAVKPTKTDVGIAIANTGVHIPANHIPQIFEKFYRVPELDKKQYGGSGLGLALARQLVRNLDGTIEAKSTKQKTTFTVRLPR